MKGECMITVLGHKEYQVKTLLVDAAVRYWEDADINGVEDSEGNLVPCREGESWKPIIDIETGVITNWKQGTVAKIHYKVCDAGIYKLADEAGNIVKELAGYVPEIMCPGGEGYGDYIIMRVDENGKIDNWKIDLSEFEYIDEN